LTSRAKTKGFFNEISPNLRSIVSISIVGLALVLHFEIDFEVQG